MTALKASQIFIRTYFQEQFFAVYIKSNKDVLLEILCVANERMRATPHFSACNHKQSTFHIYDLPCLG